VNPHLAADLHDRAHVRRLHHAHADHIESLYRGMLALPANPAGVVIENLGGVRTFIARGERLENRAIFNGIETAEQVDAVLRHFADHRANCVIEVNPANFYVNPPTTWEKRLLRLLLDRGCAIHDFRCVWTRSAPPDGPEREIRHRWRRFDAGGFDEFVALARQVNSREDWTAESRAAQAQEGWFHYIGFDGDTPCAAYTLFHHGDVAYLASAFTHPAYRARGFQTDAVRLRTRDAFDRGAKRVFTVTDFNYTSPANLQRCGLRLAYNYLLVRRDPLPL